MRYIRYYLLGGILLFLCNTLIGCSAPSDSSSSSEKESESFDEFFEKFCLEEEFQLSRIKFPLETIQLDDDTYDYDTVYVDKRQWRHLRFDYFPDKDARSQIYDNFKREMNDSDERVFEWRGIGNGIEDYYYFKRIKGLWYLVKEEDFSI